MYADWPCVAAMALGTTVPFGAMAIMARRGAPLAPGATAAFAALAGGALSSVTACLARSSPHPTTSTVLAWHLGTLLMLVLLAVSIGHRLFRWRVHLPLAAER